MEQVRMGVGRYFLGDRVPNMKISPTRRFVHGRKCGCGGRLRVRKGNSCRLGRYLGMRYILSCGDCGNDYQAAEIPEGGYVVGRTPLITVKTISMRSDQYRELVRARGLYSKKAGRNLTFGEFAEYLAKGYLKQEDG